MPLPALPEPRLTASLIPYAGYAAVARTAAAQSRRPQHEAAGRAPGRREDHTAPRLAGGPR
jgi:hypothetical protein